MEADSGKNFTRLINDLKKNAPAYSVFYAAYLCEKLLKNLHPDRNEEIFEQEGLQFRPFEDYVFPASNIRSFRFDENVMTFVINFLGLYGINAPLPRCYHDQVAIQQNIHGPGEVPIQNFLDIFNNRFYWLYYQSWKKYRYYLQIDDHPDNKTVQRVFSFIGQSALVKKSRLPFSQFKLLQLSGVLSNRVRSKAGLLIMLKAFFPRFQFDLKEFIPTMVNLAETPELGSSNKDQAFKLGQNSIIGRSVLDYMSRICLIIGPVEFEDYLKFIPGGRNITLLKQLLDIYINDNIEYDIKFIVNTAGARAIHWNDKRLRLGQSMWLGNPKQEMVHFYNTYEYLHQAV